MKKINKILLNLKILIIVQAILFANIATADFAQSKDYNTSQNSIIDTTQLSPRLFVNNQGLINLFSTTTNITEPSIINNKYLHASDSTKITSSIVIALNNSPREDRVLLEQGLIDCPDILKKSLIAFVKHGELARNDILQISINQGKTFEINKKHRHLTITYPEIISSQRIIYELESVLETSKETITQVISLHPDLIEDGFYTSNSFPNRAFNNPHIWRQLITSKVQIAPLELYTGKSISCVFLTKFCPVGCKHCFFKSPRPGTRKNQDDALTPEGVNRLIDFLNKANTGYLLISGGGDPFMELKAIEKIAEHVKANKIVLVTSGFWAKDFNTAKKIMQKIYTAFNKRPANRPEIVLRLSLDSGHAENVGITPAINLIRLFQKHYKDEQNFKLQMHSLLGDTTINNVLKHFEVKEMFYSNESFSDLIKQKHQNHIIKISSQKLETTLSDGFKLITGFAKLFNANFEVDLHDPEIVKKNTAVFDHDILENEADNTAVSFNCNGEKGLDFTITYDGIVRVWGANSPHRVNSLYKDDYEAIIDQAFNDINSLAYIEKGYSYRERIINEVNPLAAIRTKAINIRDYIGDIINEEAKTRLYLSIRIIQDYIREGRIDSSQVKSWPVALQKLVSLPKKDLIKAYNEAEFSIVDQYIKTPNIQLNDLLKLYRLIKRGHYDATIQELSDKISASKQLSETMKKQFFEAIAQKQTDCKKNNSENFTLDQLLAVSI